MIKRTVFVALCLFGILSIAMVFTTSTDTALLKGSVAFAADDMPEQNPTRPGVSGHRKSIEEAIKKYKDEQRDSPSGTGSDSGKKKKDDISDLSK